MERYAHLTDDFRNMKNLALTLRRRRIYREPVDFNFDEAKVSWMKRADQWMGGAMRSLLPTG